MCLKTQTDNAAIATSSVPGRQTSTVADLASHWQMCSVRQVQTCINTYVYMYVEVCTSHICMYTQDTYMSW